VFLESTVVASRSVDRASYL